MKSIIVFLFAISTSFVSIAQQNAFSKVSLDNNHNEETITFTIPREVNIKYYRVEASNDSVNFETISTIQSKGNSVFAVDYSYDVTPHDYKYYRVGMVLMNGQLPYSDVVMIKENTLIEQNQYKHTNPAIAAQ